MYTSQKDLSEEKNIRENIFLKFLINYLKYIYIYIIKINYERIS